MAIDATAALSRTRVGVRVVLRLHGRSPHERQTTNNALATHTHANHLQRPNSKDPGTHCRSGLLFAKRGRGSREVLRQSSLHYMYSYG